MNLRFKFNFGCNRSAQSASELAIFGAILLFVIGLIVRLGLASSQSMNQQLRAFRMALSESYRTAQGQYTPTPPGPWKASAARNVATILLIEDRLSVDPTSKLGTRDRIPFITSSSATQSQNLFYTVDYGDNFDLPIFDVVVNGQRFPFTLAGFKEVDLNNTNLPACSSHPFGGTCWEDNCFEETTVIPNPDCTTNPDFPGPAGGPGEFPCIEGAGVPPFISLITTHGCPVFYRVVVSAPEFCSGIPAECTENMLADDRFDLDFSGLVDGDEPQPQPQGGLFRNQFAWQWFKVAGVDDRISSDVILEQPREVKGISVVNGVNTLVDVDGDFKEGLTDIREATFEIAGTCRFVVPK